MMEEEFNSPTIESGRKLWNKLFCNGSLVMPEQCPLYQSYVYLYDNNTIYNPYIGRCSNSKCRKYI